MNDTKNSEDRLVEMITELDCFYDTRKLSDLLNSFRNADVDRNQFLLKMAEDNLQARRAEEFWKSQALAVDKSCRAAVRLIQELDRPVDIGKKDPAVNLNDSNVRELAGKFAELAIEHMPENRYVVDLLRLTSYMNDDPDGVFTGCVSLPSSTSRVMSEKEFMNAIDRKKDRQRRESADLLRDEDGHVVPPTVPPTRCVHGNSPAECNDCMVVGDFAFDAAREKS